VSRQPVPTVRCSPRRFEAARRRTGLSLAQLAVRAGVGRSTVGKIATGRRVELPRARAVAEALSVPLEALLVLPGPAGPE
jgi:transcriptional regulator with XRE-family HTH domain